MSRREDPIRLGERYPGADITGDEREFALAMEQYRRVKRRRFPSCREVLEVLRSLGYRKAEVKDQRSEVGDQKPEEGGPESGVRGQQFRESDYKPAA